MLLEQLCGKIIINDRDASTNMRPVNVARRLEPDAAQVTRVECKRRAVIRTNIDYDVLRLEVEPAANVLDHIAQIVAHSLTRPRAVEIAPIKEVRLDLLAQLQQPAAGCISQAVAERQCQGDADFGKIPLVSITTRESR